MSPHAPPVLPYLILAAVAAFFVAKSLWNWAEARFRAGIAESWPTAEARVEAFYLMRGADNRASYSTPGQFRYLPILQYAYAVREERYSGSFNLGVWDTGQDSANAVGNGWVGEKIRVRYKPSNPAVSVWLEQDGAPAGADSNLPYGFDDSIIDLELNK